MFIIAHFLWVGSPGTAWLTSLLKDSQSSNQGVGQTALSSGGTNGEEPVSKVTQIGRIQCLVAVRWRAPASSFHWKPPFSPRGCPQFLAMWAFPGWPLTSTSRQEPLEQLC